MASMAEVVPSGGGGRGCWGGGGSGAGMSIDDAPSVGVEVVECDSGVGMVIELAPSVGVEAMDEGWEMIRRWRSLLW